LAFVCRDPARNGVEPRNAYSVSDDVDELEVESELDMDAIVEV
jgi:hypothetical protein